MSTGKVNSSGAIAVSEYERIRLENMARNQQFLNEIGLSTLEPRHYSESSARKRKNPSPALLPEVPPELCRRSSRVAKLSQDRETDEPADLEEKESRTAVERAYKKKPPTATRPPPTPSADSARARNALLSNFLGEKLGRPVENYGKAAVMAEANGGTLPKFSKYSGVAEWCNCVFLWVNIFDSSADRGSEGVYPNEFYHGGRQMTWFGGSRMSEHTEVVQRLVRTRARAGSRVIDEELISDNNSSDIDDQIILFVRLEGENYSCFGRLAVLSCELQRSPVKFVWELKDYDRLLSEEQMKRVLKASGCLLL